MDQRRLHTPISDPPKALACSGQTESSSASQSRQSSGHARICCPLMASSPALAVVVMILMIGSREDLDGPVRTLLATSQGSPPYTPTRAAQPSPTPSLKPPPSLAPTGHLLSLAPALSLFSYPCCAFVFVSAVSHFQPNLHDMKAITFVAWALCGASAVLAQADPGPSPTNSVGCKPHGDHWYVEYRECYG